MAQRVRGGLRVEVAHQWPTRESHAPRCLQPGQQEGRSCRGEVGLGGQGLGSRAEGLPPFAGLGIGIQAGGTAPPGWPKGGPGDGYGQGRPLQGLRRVRRSTPPLPHDGEGKGQQGHRARRRADWAGVGARKRGRERPSAFLQAAGILGWTCASPPTHGGLPRFQPVFTTLPELPSGAGPWRMGP